MPQSLSKVAIHIIFSTKKHNPFFIDTGIRTELHAYLGGTCKSLGCNPIIVGGWYDHVHILCTLSRTISISDFLKDLKIRSSIWIKTKSPSLKDFSWQAGYGVYAVNESSIDDIMRYILNQEEHHRRKTFREEYIMVLKENGIEYDERYVWD